MKKNITNLDELFKDMTEEEKEAKFKELEDMFKERQRQKIEAMTPHEQKEYYTNGVRQGNAFVRNAPRIGRNDRCFCGSTKKYKSCCMEEFEDYINHQEYYDLLRKQNLDNVEKQDNSDSE